MNIVFLKNRLGYPRFAFIASKKSFKKATQRNRVKRLLREAIRLLFHRFQNLNCDIILVGKPDMINLKVYHLKEEIKNILNLLEKEC